MFYLQTVKRNQQQYDMPLKIVSYEVSITSKFLTLVVREPDLSENRDLLEGSENRMGIRLAMCPTVAKHRLFRLRIAVSTLEW